MGRYLSIGRFSFIVLAPVVIVVLALLASPHPWLAVTIPVGLVGLLALIRYPTLAYYAIIAMIPFGAFRHVMVGSLEIKLDWIAAAALLVGMIIHLVVGRNVHSNLKSRLWLPLFLFFGVNVISAVLSDYPLVVMYDMKLLLVSYILILLTLFYMNRRGFTTVLPIVISGSIALSAFLGAIGYVFDIPLFAEDVIDGPFKRALGGTNDPNTLSMMIVFGVPLMAYLLCHSRHVWQRLLVSFMLLSCVAAKVVTFSRGGAALLLITIGALFGMHRERITVRNVGLIGGIAGIIVAVVLCVIPQESWMRHDSLAHEGDSSVMRRLTYLYVAADSFVKAPVLGHGPGTFVQLYAKSNHSMQFARTPEERFRRAHNSYVEVIVGTGIVGLMLYGIILLIVLQDFGRAATLARDKGNFQLADLIKTYRLSFVMLLAYIVIFSDLQNKHLLLSFALSQVALRLAQKEEVSNL
jgi:putative inorganic carbon (HCO3(-)) transporter